MHELVRWDPQFDWTHKFYPHQQLGRDRRRATWPTSCCSASNAIEFAIATNFVFETGFTNLQFVGLSALAHGVGDRMFEKMVSSIQSDEARHAQIGAPVLAHRRRSTIARYAQYLLDKWFWRSWLLFAVVTGFAMDYLTPLEHRTQLVQGVHAGVGARSVPALARRVRPASARGTGTSSSRRSTTITTWSTRARTRYRASVWFNFVVPGPRRARLAAREVSRARGPTSTRSGSASPSAGAQPIPATTSPCTARRSWRSATCASSCCANGTPRAQHRRRRSSTTGRRYIFCSEPVPLDLRAGAGALRRRTRTSSSACSRARRPRTWWRCVQRYFGLDHDDLGQGRVRRRLPLAGAAASA